MNKTKIEWCTHTWNPVTGCRHGCPYCYAKSIVNRFGANLHESGYYVSCKINAGHLTVLGPDGRTPYVADRDGRKLYADALFELNAPLDNPYPFRFRPTFRRYELGEPVKWRSPKTVFVGSMCDLFGDWVPLRWIRDVFDACSAAPQHRYLFLTKNPARYDELETLALLPTGERFWYGATVTKTADFGKIPMQAPCYNQFLSIEPLLERVDMSRIEGCQKWVIVGAETGGNRTAKRVVPERAWVNEIAEYGAAANIPIFYKDSVRKLFPDLPESQFPWANG